MKFTITITFQKRWTIRFLRICLISFFTFCVLAWRWKGLGVAFESRDVAAIENLLFGGIITGVGVAIGVLWPKIIFRRSKGDDDIATNSNSADVAKTEPAV